jgi:AcrR family transcriptional regulator
MKLFTRYRILNATRAMVAEVGVERVTMRGIAALANITAPAIYKHFKNKRALLEEVVALGFVELADKMLARGGEAGQTQAAPQRLRIMAGAAHAYADRYPRLFEMMVAPRSNDELAVARLERELHRGMQRRELQWRNSRELAVTLWSQMRGFLSRRQEGNAREHYDRTTSWVLRPLELAPHKAAA